MARFNADSVQFTADLKGQRIIKTHLPLSMLPPNLLDTAKVILCTRNPKDSVVSFFHHEKMLPPHGLDKDADFQKYAKLYREGNTPYGDYFEYFKVRFKGLLLLFLHSHNHIQSSNMIYHITTIPGLCQASRSP